MAEEGYKVSLNVYDLSQGLARQLSSTFLGKVIEGIWHTGIVVYGNEYYFGGGIQVSPQGLTPYGRPLKEVELGTTQIPKEMLEEYLEEIKPRYSEETYSLLRHNCNNFSEEVAQFLLGVSIPDYILKLPEDVMNSPMGALILPMIQQFETTLKYGGVPQVPQAIGSAGSQLNITSGINDASPWLPFKVTPKGMDAQASSPSASTTTMAAPTSKNKEDASPPEGVEEVDKLGNARAAVQEEITREFAALMAQGSIRASEAAALAARRVMERHGRRVGLTSKS